MVDKRVMGRRRIFESDPPAAVQVQAAAYYLRMGFYVHSFHIDATQGDSVPRCSLGIKVDSEDGPTRGCGRLALRLRVGRLDLYKRLERFVMR